MKRLNARTELIIGIALALFAATGFGWSVFGFAIGVALAVAAVIEFRKRSQSN